MFALLSVKILASVSGFTSAPGTTQFAAFSVLAPGGSLVPQVGTLRKSSANPLLRGTNPWEHK
jgi:hypothetical protein